MAEPPPKFVSIIKIIIHLKHCVMETKGKGVLLCVLSGMLLFAGVVRKIGIAKTKLNKRR